MLDLSSTRLIDELNMRLCPTLLNAGVIFCWCLLMPGCSNNVKQDPWPDDMPERSYFEQQYRADAENESRQSLSDYLLWVQRFYRGWSVYPDGWNTISRSLLNVSSSGELATIDSELKILGKRIAAEWAKDNAIRKIASKHVLIWGQALQMSVAKHEVRLILQKVAADVAGLLNRNISGDMITASRFYAEEDLFQDLQ
jgi:hypothetical protein